MFIFPIYTGILTSNKQAVKNENMTLGKEKGITNRYPFEVIIIFFGNDLLRGF